MVGIPFFDPLPRSIKSIISGTTTAGDTAARMLPKMVASSRVSFRKYGARWMFDNGVDIEVISQVLNHSTVKETRTYLDIKTKDVERAMKILEY